MRRSRLASRSAGHVFIYIFRFCVPTLPHHGKMFHQMDVYLWSDHLTLISPATEKFQYDILIFSLRKIRSFGSVFPYLTQARLFPLFLRTANLSKGSANIKFWLIQTHRKGICLSSWKDARPSCRACPKCNSLLIFLFHRIPLGWPRHVQEDLIMLIHFLHACK